MPALCLLVYAGLKSGFLVVWFFFFFFVGSFGVPYIYDAALVFFSLFCRECFMLLALACRE